MTFTEEQLTDLITKGGRIVGDDGEEIEIEQDAPTDSGNKALLSVIQGLMAALKDTKTTALPAAPASPPPTVTTPKSNDCWNCEVQERDRDGRVKRIQFKAWEAPRGI